MHLWQKAVFIGVDRAQLLAEIEFGDVPRIQNIDSGFGNQGLPIFHKLLGISINLRMALQVFACKVCRCDFLHLPLQRRTLVLGVI